MQETHPFQIIIFNCYLAALLPNITSLTYLEVVSQVTDSDISVLTVYSHFAHARSARFQQVYGQSDSRILELVEGAGNSRLKELRLNLCYYDRLPTTAHMRTLQHLLKHSTIVLCGLQRMIKCWISTSTIFEFENTYMVRCHSFHCSLHGHSSLEELRILQ